MTLREQLQALREQGGSGNRLVIQGRAAWLVVHGRRGHTELRVQAATSHYLPSKLGLDQVHRLRAAGFSMPSGHKALSWSTEGEAEELEVRLLGLLEDVYGEGETETRLTLGEADLTRNEAVERALLNATLLLPVDEADAAKSFGQLASWETYAVFTDAAAVERFEPRGVVVRHVGGRDLFPQLMGAELRAGSLLVNPGGQLGGELYRNELETLAKAVRRRR
jgi:hypothetical protein